KRSAIAGRKFLQHDELGVEESRLRNNAGRQGFRDDLTRQKFTGCEVSLPGGAADHQSAQLQEARIEAPDQRNPVKSLGAKPFKNILIDKEERLDRSDIALVINDRKISILEIIPESIIQNLVISMVFPLVGESEHPRRTFGQFRARHNGDRER